MSTLKSFVKDGAEYYRLYIPCPICLREGRPSARALWSHNEDDGDMYIGDNAYYYCEKCEKTLPIIDWGYICGDCKKAGHEKAVKLTNIKEIAVAISISGMVTSEAGLEWLERLTAALRRQRTNSAPTNSAPTK